MPQEAAQQQDQGARRGPPLLLFESFQGINQSTTRPGVADEQAFWLDGFMPIAPRNLRTLWGSGAAIYTTSGPAIVCPPFFYNLGATPYAIVFLSDGSAVQFATETGVTTQVLAPGTITAPSTVDIGCSQYGSQYLLIVARQTNGYWVWDGNVVYTAGTLGPVVTLTNVGSGYAQPPLITATGGQGSGATFAATLSNGEVVGITVTNPGSGYIGSDVAGTGPGQVELVFTGGNTAGSGASLTAVMVQVPGGSGGTVALTFTSQGQVGSSGIFAYQLTGISIVNQGSGYSGHPTATLSAGSGTGTNQAGGPTAAWGPTTAVLEPNQPASPPTISLTATNGLLTSVRVTANANNPNNFWFVITSPAAFPVVTVKNSSFWEVASVTVNNGGTGYGPNCKVTASGGNFQSQASLTPVISSGIIVSVVVNNGGSYNNSTPPTLTVTDSAVTASATVSLMPFGISGTAIQTYAGHVWVFNGATFNISAPGSVSDFSTSDGGGSQQSSDSFLKIGFTQAIQTNGFLFLIGDSSMNYISGVQETTATAGGVTTVTLSYGNNNSDPEVGTPYPAAVTTLGQDILIANSAGVFVSSGGTFVKKSEALDNLWNSIPPIPGSEGPVFFGGDQLSAAKATIFGKRVWMVLVPIIDPLSGLQVNKLFMFNGRYWWASEQDVALAFIAAQEINSEYVAWGTDGRAVYPLFQQPSPNFTKIAQTKLWDSPAGYDHEKAVVNIFAMAQFLGKSDLQYQVTIDNENGVPATVEWLNSSGSVVTWVNSTPQFVAWSLSGYIGTPKSVGWVNSSGQPASWKNNQAQLVMWFVTGLAFIAVLPPTAVGQSGVVIGATVTTNCDDFVLITLGLQPEIQAYRA